LDAAGDGLAAEGELRLFVEAMLIDAESLQAQVVFLGVETETQQRASSR
jgi:EAL domain-containing protein (putative c-di-GMP-specific phosphodiesterase class I)